MKCKICGEKLSPQNPPGSPVKISGSFGSTEYDLNGKRKFKGVRDVVTRCPNGHLQVVHYDWDKGEYVETA